MAEEIPFVEIQKNKNTYRIIRADEVRAYIERLEIDAEHKNAMWETLLKDSVFKKYYEDRIAEKSSLSKRA